MSDPSEVRIKTTSTHRFSLTATFTGIDPELWAVVFNTDAIAVTDPELHARLTCEGALA